MVASSREADALDEIAGALRRAAGSPQLERHLHVLERGQRRDQLEALEDEADFLTAQPGAIVLR